MHDNSRRKGKPIIQSLDFIVPFHNCANGAR